MKFVKLLIIFSLVSNAIYSQTIINAERLAGGADSTIYTMAFSYSGTKGNSNTNLLDISPGFILLKKKNEYKIFAGYALLSQSGTKILNSGFVHLRHNYKISQTLKTFEFYQLQFNDVLLLDKREIFGAGLRYALMHKDSITLDFNFGLMREAEFYKKAALLPGEPAERKLIRITFVNSFKWIISKSITIDNVSYYQPDIKDFNNFRLLNDFSLALSINKHFDLVNSLSTRFDNNPPGSLKKMDNIIKLGFNFKF